MTGAAVAAVTERVEIRAGSVVLPLHNPLRVAEEWSVVDNLSGGRVGVSFASGWHADDFALAPGRLRRPAGGAWLRGDRDRAARCGAARRCSRRSGDRPARSRCASSRAPVQPELPVWLTAAGNPETFELAGEIGANVLTHLLGQSARGAAPTKIALYRARRAAPRATPARGT